MIDNMTNVFQGMKIKKSDWNGFWEYQKFYDFLPFFGRTLKEIFTRFYVRASFSICPPKIRKKPKLKLSTPTIFWLGVQSLNFGFFFVSDVQN
jgi:hypothetical protein